VNYDHQNWLKISKVLEKNHTTIDKWNRVQILDDAFALALAGKLVPDS
jgi:hypothetical protein